MLTKTPANDTLSTDLSSDWKTYSALEYKMAFSYPKSVTSIEKGDTSLQIATLLLSMGKDTNTGPGSSGFIAPVEIYIGDKNAERKDGYFGGFNWTQDIVTDIQARQPGENYSFTKEIRTYQNNLLIGDTTAYKYSARPMEGSAYTGVAFIRGNNSYLIMFHPELGMSETDFTKFLSSIRFTD